MQRVGDAAGAEALVMQVADRGQGDALYRLAEMRQTTGDTVGAEALYQRATDRGDS
jgi:hypothetical protein